ncbi:MAG: hypothetical protein AB1633_00605 [Elusimicrobiota bacterium]
MPEFWDGYSRDAKNYVYLYEIMSEPEASKPHKAPENFFLLKELHTGERFEKLSPVISGIK